VAALVARAVVGGLFLISAYGKIIAPEQFAEEIRAYQMIPTITTNALAYLLPWVELFAGLLLVTSVWRKEARFIIVALLVIFTGAKTYTYARGMDIDCGCGGGVEILKHIYNSPQGILTNLVLLGLLGVDWRAERRQTATPRPA
jgi:uncharacterized membrane protein YphA (DoxX/SURF4 family)